MAKVVKLDDVRKQNASKKSPKKKSPLKRFFKYAAATVAMPFVLAQGISFGTSVFPGSVSDSVEDYLAQNEIDSSFMEHVDGHNIRVYDNDAALMSFHYAGRMQRMNAGFIMKDDDLSAGGKAKALFNLVAFDYWGYLLEGAVSRVMSHNYASSAATLLVPHEHADYYIVPPAERSAAAFISEMTGIPRSHLRDMDPQDTRLFFEYIIRHEIAHTDVIPEHLADRFAIETLEDEYTDSDIAEKVRHLRAVSTFSQFLHMDYVHSTALELERFENGDPVNPIVYLNAQRATLGLYRYILNNTETQFDGYLNPKDYYISVYRTLKDAVENGRLASEPDIETLARLYVEGVQYYVPDIEAKANAEAQPQILFPGLRP